MRYFIGIYTLVLSVLLCSQVRAQGVLQNVWYEPFNTAPGDSITLSALLYNKDPKPVTFTVVFKTPEKAIGEPVVVVVEGVSAKTVSVKTVQPQTIEKVSAEITAAINSTKKDVAALHGIIGSTTIGVVSEKEKQSFSFDTSSLKGIANSFHGGIEVFRKQQAVYFAQMRDSARQALAITPNATNDLFSSNGIPPEKDLTTKDIAVYKTDNPFEYVRLIGGTALASFFGSATLFYIALVLLGFFLLRFLYRMFI